MAKTIKTIKCPQCGSTKANEIRTDYYSCNSCGADYFIDSDDININHNYNYNHNPIDKAKLLKIGLAVFLVIICTFFLTNICSSPKHESPPKTVPSVAEQAPESKKTPIYKWRKHKGTLFVDAKGTPYYIVMGYLEDKNDSYNQIDKNSLYVGLYNPKDNKKIWIKKLNNDATTMEYDNIQVNTFEDGNVYFILKNKTIYQLQKNDFAIKNITEEYSKNNDMLRVGIAKIEFKDNKYGSCFLLTNNEGKLLSYYPLINEAYPENKVHLHRRAELPRPSTTAGFGFSTKSTSFPDEILQLISYTYRYQYGFPKENPRFEWDKDYGRAGIFYGGEPYVKRLINNYMKEGTRLINYKDLTPGRLYFEPRVLAYNNEKLLIAFNPTPAEDDSKQIQLLEASTGKILHTISSDKKYFDDNNFILADGIIVESSDVYFYYNNNGNLVNTFDISTVELNSLN